MFTFLGNLSGYTAPTTKRSEAEASLEALDAFIVELAASDIELSDESLKSLLLTTVDIFGRIFNVFRTLIFRSFRSLKRSEMRAYSESTVTRIMALEGLPIDQFLDETVHIPDSMTCTGIEAVEYIQQVYRAVDLVPLLTAVNREVKLILNLLHRQQNDETIDIDIRLGVDGKLAIGGTITSMLKRVHGETLAKGMDPDLAASNRAEQVFSTTSVNTAGEIIVADKKLGHKLRKAKFSSQFKSMREFKDYRRMLLALEPRLIAVASVDRAMENLAADVDLIVKFVELAEQKVNREFVQALAVQVRHVASLVSYYGYAAGVQMTLEHNHVLTLAEMISEKL